MTQEQQEQLITQQQTPGYYHIMEIENKMWIINAPISSKYFHWGRYISALFLSICHQSFNRCKIFSLSLIVHYMGNFGGWNSFSSRSFVNSHHRQPDGPGCLANGGLQILIMSCPKITIFTMPDQLEKKIISSFQHLIRLMRKYTSITTRNNFSSISGGTSSFLHNLNRYLM